MITQTMHRKLTAHLPDWLGLRHCPWCKNRTLIFHAADEPWRTRLDKGMTVIRGTPWFRCGHCGQDGTLEFLYYTVFPEAPEPDGMEGFRPLFSGGLWDRPSVTKAGDFAEAAASLSQRRIEPRSEDADE